MSRWRALENLALEAGKSTARDIIATTANGMSSPRRWTSPIRDSVAAFAGAWDGPLHIFVNNASVMATPELRTPEGWEMQFATNHHVDRLHSKSRRC
ncbi:MAG: hypothetical protein WA484_07260 [Solirubrobacteraceae bacterium]